MRGRFNQVPFETAEPPSAGALIKIFRLRGKVVATVVRYEWFEPDGHEHTGYADVVETDPAPAAEVIAEFRKHTAQVAIESEGLWQDSWGQLDSDSKRT